MAAAAAPMAGVAVQGQLASAVRKPGAIAKSIRSQSPAQINIWRFLVRFYFTWPNNLVPCTETEASLKKYPELRRLNDWMEARAYNIGQVKHQLRLLKDQVHPQVRLVLSRPLSHSMIQLAYANASSFWRVFDKSCDRTWASD